MEEVSNTNQCHNDLDTTDKVPTPVEEEKDTVPDFSGLEEHDASTLIKHISGGSDGNHTNSNNTYQPKWASSSTKAHQSLGTSGESDDVGASDDEKGDSNEDEVDSEDDLEYIDDLPAFADEASKQLHKRTKEMEQERDDTAENVQMHRNRVKVMKEHLLNVRQEMEHTNRLLAARMNEIQTEKHLISLEERERAAIIAENKRKVALIDKERTRCKKIQEQISAANEEKEKLKLALNWNQEELEQWATAAAKKEEDNLALERYTRADEVKIKDLTLKIENLTRISFEKKAELENEITETQSKNLELDQTAKYFKSQQTERQQLLHQWQDTLKAMKERDIEINVLSEKYAGMNKTYEEHLNACREKRETLATLEVEKHDLKKQIEVANRELENKKQDRLSTQQSRQVLQDEVDVLKVESLAAEVDLQKSEKELAISNEELKLLKERLDKEQMKCDALKDNLDSDKKTTLDKDKVTQNIELQLKEREKEKKDVESQLESLQKQMVTDSRKLAGLRETESGFIAEIKSTQATAKNMSSKLRQLQQEYLKKQEIIYNVDFQVEQMDRKIARGLGVRSDEEKKKLQSSIAQLQEEETIKDEKIKKVTQQCKKLDHELQMSRREKDQLEKNRKSIEESIAETELEISSCELNLKQMVSQLEANMVSHDIVRLEMCRLRDTLKKRTEEVLALKDKRQEILDSMLERKKEIDIEMEVKVAQLRAAEEERHKSAVEFGKRSLVAEKMKLKYEMLARAHHTDDSDNGNDSEHSHVYHLIAAAQKRADLQREGDKLDAQIIKREKELKAMEKTLAHLKKRNTEFRKSFSNVDPDSDEYKELLELEEELRKSENEVFLIKKEQHDKQRSSEKEKKRLGIIDEQLSKVKEENRELQDSLKEADADLEKESEIVRQLEIQIQEKRSESINGSNEEDKSTMLKKENAILQRINEDHCKKLMRMLMEVGREFPALRNDIIADLVREGFDVTSL